MSAIPYIGSQISLISKSDIRYEGTLHTIEPTEHTVSLSNVKSFGTEGRRGNGKEIPPSTEVYEFIIFRGSDIKDLSVIQTTQNQSETPAVQPKAEEKPKFEERPKNDERKFQIYRPRGYRQRGTHGELHENVNEDLKQEVQEDFDFQANLISRDEKIIDKNKAYDKKRGFFDTISSGDREENKFDRQKQKETDSETFGEESVENGARELRRYMGRGRRRGRGFRNRGYGQEYRGGYGGYQGDREYTQEYRGGNRGYHQEFRGADRENSYEYRGRNRGYNQEHRDADKDYGQEQRGRDRGDGYRSTRRPY